MPSLHNSTSFASPRVCYWAPGFVQESQPFCTASKLTEEESEIWDAFDDMLLTEHLKEMQKEGYEYRASEAQPDIQGDEFAFDRHSVRKLEAKKHLNRVFLSEAQYLRELAKKGWICNTQPIAGAPSKTVINRHEFLTR